MSWNVSPWAAVIGRLERLERENRVWRRAGLVVITTAAGLLWMGQVRSSARNARPETLEAQAVVIRDPRGKERAWLGMWEESPRLVLYDKDGNLRLALGVQADGSPALVFGDRGRTDRVWLRIEEDGSTNLTLRDRQGLARAVLSVDKAGAPTLRLFDPGGKASYEAP